MGYVYFLIIFIIIKNKIQSECFVSTQDAVPPASEKSLC